jgi:hypothetical protein
LTTDKPRHRTVPGEQRQCIVAYGEAVDTAEHSHEPSLLCHAAFLDARHLRAEEIAKPQLFAGGPVATA